MASRAATVEASQMWEAVWAGRRSRRRPGCWLPPNAYVVARQARPHRPGLDEDAAGAALRRLAQDDQLDARAVDAVLRASGDRGPRVRRHWPAGLTDREVDVLRQVAIGRSIQEAAAQLRIAAKTVDFHLQNVYARIGVGAPAAATLFAVQSELIEPQKTRENSRSAPCR